MDWKYKHFNHEAVYNAPINDVLETARAVVGESFGQIENTAEGFVARGHSAWHSATATFRVGSVATGTRLGVELLVERASGRGYMLWDVGGYYIAEIDKWFSAIAERLGQSGAPALVSKSTSRVRWQRSCLAGCAVWFAAALCLGMAGTALDQSLFPRLPSTSYGPFTTIASVLGLLAGIGGFVYVAYPESSFAKSVRGWLGRTRKF